MTIHPRHVPVEEARQDLACFLLAWRDKHALTSAEFFALLTDALASLAWGLVRSERREEGKA